MLSKYNIAAKVVDAGGKLTVRSALNPILWLCAIVTIPSLLAIPFIDNPPLWLIGLVCSPVAAAIVGFLFLLLFDRDKLQSEDYQIRKQSLEFIQQKGDKDALIIDAEEVEAIANPEIKRIGSGNKEVQK